MMDFITIFFAGYLSVFLLGFQSRLVNTGNFIGAALCSFTISIFQASLWSHLMKSPSFGNTMAYGLAGSAAITSAIFVHQKMFGKTVLDKTVRVAA